MPKGDVLGVFEQWVMLALIRLGDNAYGMTIRREIQAHTDRPISLGAVYTTLDRLEGKGYVTSEDGPGSPERKGRARRFFRVEPPGFRALEEALEAMDCLREGLPAKLLPDRGAPFPDRGFKKTR